MSRTCVRCGGIVRLGHGIWAGLGKGGIIHAKAAECKKVVQLGLKLKDAPQGNVGHREA